MKRKCYSFVAAGALVCCFAPCAMGERITSVSGSCTLRQSYDSNVDLTHENEEGNWYTTLSPSLSISSTGRNDNLIFSYTPGFKVNQTRDDSNLDHDFYLNGDKQFTARLKAGFSERFYKSDDSDYTFAYVPSPETPEFVPEDAADRTLSAKRERNRFWTNTFSVRSAYEFANNSQFLLGYSNRILENKLSTEDDYKKHNPNAAVDYEFNHAWHGNLSYSYIKGNFDISDDLEEHVAGIGLSHLVNPHDTVSGNYKFSTTHYEGESVDYSLHDASLGWQRELSAVSSFSVSGGISQLNRDVGSDESAFNYSVDYSRSIKRGSISISGAGGIDETQFSGEPNNTAADDLSKYWSVRGGLNYNLLERLTASCNASYRQDDYFERATNNKEKLYGGGVGMAYGFGRWYSLSLGYSYRRLDSDIDTDDYDDHRLFISVSAAKELMHW